MLFRKSMVRTSFLLILLLSLVLLSPSLCIAASNYDVTLIPDVRNNTWSQLGTVVIEAEPGALIDGEVLIFRLSNNCKFYEPTPSITGPVIKNTSSGKQIVYTVAGTQNGQLRIVIPEKVRGNSNDLFTASGNDPFRINSLHDNEIIMVLQNYDSTFGENRFLIYCDEAFAVADEYRAVRLYFETMSGSGWSDGEVSVAGYDFICPFAPTNLQAIAVSETQINLSWQDNSINEEGYIVLMKREGDDSHKEIARVGANSTSYSLTDLQPGINYSFLVKAYNSNCLSTPSNIANATTFAYLQKIDELVFEIGNLTYCFNGRSYQMDAAPLSKWSRTLLPVRHFAEILGAQVDWDGNDKRIDIALNETRIQLWVAKPFAKVDGNEMLIDALNPQVVPEITASGRTMVPLRFIAETLECSVDWDEQTDKITITRTIAD